MTLEERADAIATEANNCCNRSDGYEEHINAIALNHLRALQSQIDDAELALNVWDYGQESEYWLRYHPVKK